MRHHAGHLADDGEGLVVQQAPFLFLHHEYRPDSGGAGQYRGGTGADLEMVIETGKTAVGNTAGDGVRHGARGMLGGNDGAPHHYLLRHADGRERELKTKEVGIEILSGDTLVVHSGGGGGWGDPAKRDAAATARDIENGIVTKRS